MRPLQTAPFVLFAAAFVAVTGVGCKKRPVKVKPNEIPPTETTTPAPPPPGSEPTPGKVPPPTSPTTPPGSGQTQTRVRIIHAGLDAPALDIYVRGEPAAVVERLAYKTATVYTPLSATRINARATASGSPQTALLGPTDLEFTPGRDHTVIPIGSAKDGALGSLVLTDDNTPPAEGKAKARIVHAAPDAPAVDAVAEGRTVLSNLAFGKAGGGYAEVPAGTYPLKITASDGSAALIGPVPLALRAGKIYTVVMMGKASNCTLSLQVYTDN